MRYHCPVYFVLNFHKYIGPALNRHIWLYDRRNYLSFAHDIMETNWETSKNNNIDIYTQNVTNEISKIAKNTFQIKQLRYDSQTLLGLQAK